MAITDNHMENLNKMGEDAMDAILGDSTEFVARIAIEEFEEKLLPIINGSNKDDLTVWLDVSKAWGNEIEVYEYDGSGWSLVFTVPALSGRTANPSTSDPQSSINNAVENAIKQAQYTPAVADKQLLRSLDGKVRPDTTTYNLNLSRWYDIYERYGIEHNIPKVEVDEPKKAVGNVEYDYEEF